MPTARIIVLVIIAIVILLTVAIVYSLSPTQKNVSEEPVLKALLGKHFLKTKTYLNKAEKGQYELLENQLTARSDYPGTRLLNLPVGTEITIEQFKTCRNNLGAGFTNLYALGFLYGKQGKKISFEYCLGSVERDFYSIEDYSLPFTVWQDSIDKPIQIPANNR